MYLIDSIGEVQINSEPKIVKAEEPYLALSYEQRDLVTNYPVLTSARTNVDIRGNTSNSSYLCNYRIHNICIRQGTIIKYF